MEKTYVSVSASANQKAFWELRFGRQREWDLERLLRAVIQLLLQNLRGKPHDSRAKYALNLQGKPHDSRAKYALNLRGKPHDSRAKYALNLRGKQHDSRAKYALSFTQSLLGHCFRD